jgi:hypothetical protein
VPNRLATFVHLHRIGGVPVALRMGPLMQINLKCAKCKQPKPIKGGKRYGAGRNGGPCVFVCLDCNNKREQAKCGK